MNGPNQTWNLIPVSQSQHERIHQFFDDLFKMKEVKEENILEDGQIEEEEQSISPSEISEEIRNFLEEEDFIFFENIQED
jgi:hypothetical protein